jgi:hypothetical protein
MSRQFKNGTAFPSEGFVQQAIEAYFAHLGYSLHTDTDVDLICTAPDGRPPWHIEAKGKTQQVGLDFRTCLGQLLQRMHLPHAQHGVAVPDIDVYHRQIAKVRPWVVATLGLHWLLVDAAGNVTIVAPDHERQLPQCRAARFASTVPEFDEDAIVPVALSRESRC